VSGMNHFDERGNAVMVDVSGKDITSRTAQAQGEIYVSAEIMDAVLSGSSKKGDALGVARVAGIMAAKRTGGLIPLCHPLSLTNCAVDFETEPEKGIIRAICTVKTDGKTGVEMEALTGVSVALLTVYDMCKAVDKKMVIGNIHLIKKQGGKSGDFVFGGDAYA
jgi:cyclic pyranopterin phosphate synthase